MTTVAITGATGLIGSALAYALADEGANIIAMSRPNSNREILAGLDVTWREGDVTKPESLIGLFRDADWLIHAAGMLGRASIPDEVYQQIHVEGTHNVLSEANHCKRILYISSPGVLGPIEGVAADENTTLAPSNPYERSKAAAEIEALSFFRRGWPVIIARPEFIYGPGDMHVLGLFRAIKKGLFFYVGDGRNFCHPTFIDDAIDGLLRCLKQGTPGEIYHITGPRPVTFRELGEIIATELEVSPPWISVPKPVSWIGAWLFEKLFDLIGKDPPLSRTGVAFFSEDRRFSWEKARQTLGYTPQFDLANGVKRSVAWYKEKELL